MGRKLISFDWAIKRILRSKANFEILEGFLSELLFEDITILEVLESESNKARSDDKFNRVDLKVKDSREQIILIEIQYDRELDYMQRILYATSKAVTEHMREGDPYANVKKVITVNILYFDFGDGDDYIYKGTTSFIGLHNHTRLKLTERQAQLYKAETIESLYPEHYLIKVKNFNDVAKDTLDEWIYFLKNAEIKEEFNARGLVKAKETLDMLRMSEEERSAYAYYLESLHRQASAYQSTFVEGHVLGKKEGMAQGHSLGKQEGLVEGRAQEKQEIVRNCLIQGMDVATICAITGLSEEVVAQMRAGR